LLRSRNHKLKTRTLNFRAIIEFAVTFDRFSACEAFSGARDKVSHAPILLSHAPILLSHATIFKSHVPILLSHAPIFKSHGTIFKSHAPISSSHATILQSPAAKNVSGAPAKPSGAFAKTNIAPDLAGLAAFYLSSGCLKTLCPKKTLTIHRFYRIRKTEFSSIIKSS
jgi:hypothetical protein